MDWRAISRSRSRIPMDWRPTSRSRSRPPGQPFDQGGFFSSSWSEGKFQFPSYDDAGIGGSLPSGSNVFPMVRPEVRFSNLHNTGFLPGSSMPLSKQMSLSTSLPASSHGLGAVYEEEPSISPSTITSRNRIEVTANSSVGPMSNNDTHGKRTDYMRNTFSSYNSPVFMPSSLPSSFAMAGPSSSSLRHQHHSSSASNLAEMNQNAQMSFPRYVRKTSFDHTVSRAGIIPAGEGRHQVNGRPLPPDASSLVR